MTFNCSSVDRNLGYDLSGVGREGGSDCSLGAQVLGQPAVRPRVRESAPAVCLPSQGPRPHPTPPETFITQSIYIHTSTTCNICNTSDNAIARSIKSAGYRGRDGDLSSQDPRLQIHQTKLRCAPGP